MKTNRNAPSEYNLMCLNCSKLNKTCKGTTCQTWTGCVIKNYNELDENLVNNKNDIHLS